MLTCDRCKAPMQRSLDLEVELTLGELCRNDTGRPVLREVMDLCMDCKTELRSRIRKLLLDEKFVNYMIPPGAEYDQKFFEEDLLLNSCKCVKEASKKPGERVADLI